MWIYLLPLYHYNYKKAQSLLGEDINMNTCRPKKLNKFLGYKLEGPVVNVFPGLARLVSLNLGLILTRVLLFLL